MDSHALSFELPAAEDTQRLGAALAAAMPSAVDRWVVVHLRGELGAGKTTLVRGFLHARGVTQRVRSPTYTLIEPYAGADQTYVHVDLYRLRGAAEVADLGLGDYLVAGHLILIEWPERGGGALPRFDLHLDLAYAGQGREVVVRGQGALWPAWRENLVSDTSLIPYLSNLA